MDEVKRFTQYGLEKWSLQELVPGRLEYSTTLLVLEGQVVDYVNTLYESIESVWKIRILLVYFTFLFLLNGTQTYEYPNRRRELRKTQNIR